MGWKVGSADFWTLGKFEPSKAVLFDDYDLIQAFRGWVGERTSSLKNVQVRSPEHAHSIASDIAYQGDYYNPPIDAHWHHDGVFPREFMVVWSNLRSTQMIRQGHPEMVFEPEPGEVVLFDNDAFMHRRPPIRSLRVAQKRWFIRSSILKGAVIRDVPGVYRYLT